MSEFLSVLRAELRNPVPYLLVGTLGLLLAIAGPFGSYLELRFVQRLLFWGLCMALGMGVGILWRVFMQTVLGVTDFRLTSVLVALLCTLTLSWPFRELAYAMFPDRHVFSASLRDTALLVFSVAWLVGAIRHQVTAGLLTSLGPYDGPIEPLEQAALPRIVRRLDAALQGRLVAMTVRDHYVDVYTVKGRGSVLLRFADAMAEAEGEAGGQIHRSHWVAWWSVKGAEREGGKLYLRMCPELRLPVSRTYRDSVEARGLVPKPETEPAAGPLAAE